MVERPGILAPEIIENPESETLPAGSAVVYRPPRYSRFSDNSSDRMVLLQTSDGAATDADIIAAFPTIYDNKYARLWQAAHEYEFASINGSALSLLVLGVMQQKPLSLAIQAWLTDLWSEYYKRKAAVTVDAEPDLDYSTVGQMPCTIPEFTAELGVVM
jgi:hypothetical protein